MIHYLQGDATAPTGEGPKIIAHVCNSVGGWGRGFVKAISKRWPEPEAAYRAWFRDKIHPNVCGLTKTFGLGYVQVIPVEPDLWVANMVAQRGYGPRGSAQHREEGDTSIPLEYEALALCLVRVGGLAERLGASIHAPRIGCGLGGSTWDKIEPLIQQSLQNRQVYVYDYVR